MPPFASHWRCVVHSSVCLLAAIVVVSAQTMEQTSGNTLGVDDVTNGIDDDVTNGIEAGGTSEMIGLVSTQHPAPSTTTVHITTLSPLDEWLIACVDTFEQLDRDFHMGYSGTDYDCLCMRHCSNRYFVEEEVLAYNDVYRSFPPGSNYNWVESDVFFCQSCAVLFYVLHFERELWSWDYRNMCNEFVFDWDDQELVNVFLSASNTNNFRAERKQALITAFATTLGVAFFFGLIGNLAVIISVFAVLRKSSVTNIFIGNLAIMDMLVVLIAMPMRFLEIMNLDIHTIDNNFTLCRFVTYVYYTAFFVTIFLICAMALERYIVIIYPMKAKAMSTPARARKIMVVVWFMGVAAAAPTMITLQGYNCSFKPNTLGTHAVIIYLALVGYALPLMFLTFTYGRVAKILYASISTAAQLTTGGGKGGGGSSASSDAIARLQVVRMLIALVVAFALFWAPVVIGNVMVYFARGIVVNFRGMEPNDFSTLCSLVSLTGCSVNPYLYALFSRQYRSGFLYVFSCGRYKIDTGTGSSTGSSRTVSTTVGGTTAASAAANQA